MELVIVVTIMSIIAGGAVMAFSGMADEAEEVVCRNEMQTIRKALLQFKQDMGVLPGQDKLEFSNLVLNGKPQEWFESHANMSQLFTMPVDKDNADRHEWNIDTKRGWRGPYLTRDGNGLVSIGQNPDYNSGTVIADVPAIGDSFDATPIGLYYEWNSFGGTSLSGKHGRPYLFLDFNTTDARIVSMGPDNDADTSDHITLYLFK